MDDPRASRATREARRTALGILRQAGLACALVLPLSLKASCMAFSVWSVAWAWPRTWAAFGGDAPALLPAAIVVLPIAGALAAGLGWGGLLVGGVAALAIGYFVSSVDPVTRALVVAGALALVVAQAVFGQSQRRMDD